MEQVSLLECRSYEFPAIKRAVDLQFEQLDLDRLLIPGKHAVIKPNLVIRSDPESACVTHPLVTAAIGTHLKEHGLRVTIAESPGGLYTPVLLKNVYQGCGYAEMAEQYGLELNLDCSCRSLEVPEGKRSRLFEVITPVLEADLIVSAAKMKSHCMTGISCAVKNMFGSVPGLMKPELHCRFPEKQDFCQMLVDLCEGVRPAICFVDGIVAMEGNGPTGGRPREMGVLAAGENPYAVDFVCASLMSMDPREVPLLQAAEERGLCPASLAEIKIVGGAFADFAAEDFLQPESKTSDFIKRLPEFLRPAAAKIATPFPRIRRRDCVGCGKCAQSCPQHTIHIVDRKAEIDYRHCIRCFCCHEMCPERAVDIKRFSLFRL